MGGWVGGWVGGWDGPYVSSSEEGVSCIEGEGLEREKEDRGGEEEIGELPGVGGWAIGGWEIGGWVIGGWMGGWMIGGWRRTRRLE